MSNHLSHHILPTPQSDVEEVFAVHQATQQFHEEVRHRQALEDYCGWYARLAEQHRQELKILQRDVNLFRWFLGPRR